MTEFKVQSLTCPRRRTRPVPSLTSPGYSLPPTETIPVRSGNLTNIERLQRFGFPGPCNKGLWGMVIKFVSRFIFLHIEWLITPQKFQNHDEEVIFGKMQITVHPTVCAIIAPLPRALWQHLTLFLAGSEWFGIGRGTFFPPSPNIEKKKRREAKNGQRRLIVRWKNSNFCE